jgi:putative tricarboxylic transport membrane protein
MESLTGFLDFIRQFPLALSPKLLLASALGSILGIVWGAMPALSTTMAMALLIGFSTVLDLHTAIMFLLAVYTGSTFGGSISAIFINIPGTPAAVCTAIEGFPLAKKGEGTQALGTAIIASSLGNLFGLLFLIVLFPFVMAIALRFASWEMFLVALMGIIISGTLTGGDSILKGWISVWIGVFLSLVGLDPMDAYPRFTLGFNQLVGGIGFVPVMVGLFGMCEILRVLPERTPYTMPYAPGRTIPTFRMVRKIFKTSVRSGLIGAIIGAIPALGPDIAAFTAYGIAKKRASREEYEKYGKGSYDGIAAAETANNACIGGTLLPLLTLGIPGGIVAALFGGALNLKNVIVGPMINFHHPGLVNFHYAALIVGLVFMYILALLIAKPTLKVLSTPRQILMPILVPLCVLAAFASNLNKFDIYVMVFFALLAYGCGEVGIPMAPLCMGMILGPLAEVNLRRSIEIFSNQPFWAMFSRPVADVILLINLWLIIDIFRKPKFS